MRSSNARAAGWTAMILAALLIPPPGPAHAGEGLEIIASLIKAIQSPGRIDYAERINAPLREGVTPENNFFAAIFPLTPLDTLDESDGEWVQSLCDEIGCVHPAEEPVKFVFPMDVEYSDEPTDSKVRGEIFSAKTSLWKPEENPVAQAWVLANEASWKRAVEAANRPHAYRPLIPPNGKPLLFSSLPDLQMLRAVAELGAVRVNRSIARKDLTTARADLLAIHRMACHVGQASSAMQLVVAYALQASFRVAEAHYLSHSEMTSKERMAYLAEIERLPPSRSMREVFDSAERWSTIDGLDFYRRGILDPAIADEFTTDRTARWQQFCYWLAFAAIVDWTNVNDGANAIYDLVDNALSLSTGAERESVVESLLYDIRQYSSMLPGVSAVDNGFEKLRNTAKDLLHLDRDQRGQLLGNILAARIVPNFQSAELTERVHQCREAMLPALIAVLSDFDRTGHPRLDTIGLRLPDGRALETDPFNGEPYRISYGWDTITIYSLGPDGEDQGGQVGDLYDGTVADDVYLRFQSANTPQKLFKREVTDAPKPFWEAEIPRQWKGIGIILASLSFGAVALWLRRRNA